MTPASKAQEPGTVSGLGGGSARVMDRACVLLAGQGERV